MRYSLLFFILLFAFACQQEKAITEQQVATQELDFSITTASNPELKFNNLQLFPITASETFIANNSAAKELVNLKEAIENKRFRITEKKPYGRQDDGGAVNTLTVQNKSEHTVFLMAGDVVQGGRQDRVIAADIAIPPRTITDIPVFCVEQNRWNYKENDQIVEDHIAQQNKKIFAFTGYYNVASFNVRRSVTKRNQQEVWETVSQITSSNNATTASKAYAGLEQSEDYTHLRNQYLRFFENKFDTKSNIIGVVAVSGNEVLGADIFANPELFSKQYKALIHGYITDAITTGSEVKASEERIEFFAKELEQDYAKAPANAKYKYNGAMVHYTKH